MVSVSGFFSLHNQDFDCCVFLTLVIPSECQQCRQGKRGQHLKLLQHVVNMRETSQHF